MNLPRKTRYKLNQCALYKCMSKRKLAQILKLKLEDLNSIKEVIQYYSFKRAKKDGDSRLITAPTLELKKIQKRILNLLSYVERPDWLISGERGKSYVDNGKAHQYSEFFLTVDIRKFYDNCRREYVYRFFQNTMCTSKDVAALLTDIVTYEKKVPTGCPTSQMIAFYGYFDMFEKIVSIAHKFGCTFTLYVDDMTFSGVKSFNPNQLSNEVDKILRSYGHKPKYSKVKYYPRKSYKLVTGVVISGTHRLLVANNLRKKIYDGAMEQLDRNNRGIQQNGKELRSLRGRLQAARYLNPHIFPEINRMVERSLGN